MTHLSIRRGIDNQGWCSHRALLLSSEKEGTTDTASKEGGQVHEWPHLTAFRSADSSFTYRGSVFEQGTHGRALKPHLSTPAAIAFRVHSYPDKQLCRALRWGGTASQYRNDEHGFSSCSTGTVGVQLPGLHEYGAVGGSAHTTSAAMWACQHCTFMNQPGTGHCEMCSLPRT